MAEEYDRNNKPSWNVEEQCLNPLINVEEEEGEVIVTADLPCVEKEDIDVFVEGDTVILKAKTKRDLKFERWGGVYRKVSFNSFKKIIPLKTEVDPDKVTAKFRKGILEIRLKKKKTKKIDVE